MCAVRFVPALLLLAYGSVPVGAAVDLTKIERTIAQEPAYRSAPKYCLLVFGTEAKARKWLVLDGDDVYVDRNGNGDLTEADEKVSLKISFRFDLGAFPDADGVTREAKLLLNRSAYGGPRLEFTVGDQFKQFVGFDPLDRLAFADRAQDAPIVHFGGPLTFRWFAKAPELIAGQNCRFYSALGTPGLGKGSFAAVQCCSVPSGTELVAQLDYPHRDAGQPPIQEKLKLGAD